MLSDLNVILDHKGMKNLKNWVYKLSHSRCTINVLHIVPQNPQWIWTRNVYFEYQGEKLLSHERIFKIYTKDCGTTEQNMSQNEKLTFKGRKWWHLHEIAASKEAFRPPEIMQQAGKIIAGMVINTPIEID